jgi:hypothetical protein
MTQLLLTQLAFERNARLALIESLRTPEAVEALVSRVNRITRIEHMIAEGYEGALLNEYEAAWQEAGNNNQVAVVKAEIALVEGA